MDLRVNSKIVQIRPTVKAVGTKISKKNFCTFVNILIFLRENKEASFFLFWIFKLKQPWAKPELLLIVGLFGISVSNCQIRITVLDYTVLFSELELLSDRTSNHFNLEKCSFSVIFLQLSVHALLLYFSSGEKKVKKFYSNTIWSFGGRNKTGILLPKLLRSLEQFIQTVKGQNNFW